MKSIEAICAELPERGWATVREVNPFVAVQMALEDVAHVQYTPHQGVYQMRLTRTGRAMREEALRDGAAPGERDADGLVPARGRLPAPGTDPDRAADPRA